MSLRIHVTWRQQGVCVGRKGSSKQQGGMRGRRAGRGSTTGSRKTPQQACYFAIWFFKNLINVGCSGFNWKQSYEYKLYSTFQHDVLAWFFVCLRHYLKNDFCRSLDAGLSSALQGLSVTETHLVELDGETLSLYGSGALECLDRNWSVQTAGMVTTVSFTFIEFDEIVQVLPKLKMKFPNSLVNTFLWKYIWIVLHYNCVFRPKPASASFSVVSFVLIFWHWNLN